jgi:hypothetical protein
MGGEVAAVGGGQKTADFPISILVNPITHAITGCYGEGSVGGGGSGGITISATNRTCPSGQYVSGINLDGSVICAVLPAGGSGSSPTTTTTISTPTTTTTTLPAFCPAQGTQITLVTAGYGGYTDRLHYIWYLPQTNNGGAVTITCDETAAAMGWSSTLWQSKSFIASCSNGGWVLPRDLDCQVSTDCRSTISSIAEGPTAWAAGAVIPSSDLNPPVVSSYAADSKVTYIDCSGGTCHNSAIIVPNLARATVGSSVDVNCNGGHNPYPALNFGAQKFRAVCYNTGNTISPPFHNGIWQYSLFRKTYYPTRIYEWSCKKD